MLLIPAIDLKDGQCVRLKQGEMDDATVFSSDPGAMARHWLEAGARKRSTIEQRRWWLIRLGETFAEPWQVTATDLALWLSRGDWAPETKRLGRSSVQTFYRWAEMVGRVPVSPARDTVAPGPQAASTAATSRW